MAERRPAKTTRCAERVIPVDLPPARYRPPRHEAPETEEDAKGRVRFEIDFERHLFSLRLALAIQDRCGLFPLTASDTSRLKAFDKMVADSGDLNRNRGDGEMEAVHASLHIEADRLLEGVSCGHCQARFACPRGRA